MKLVLENGLLAAFIRLTTNRLLAVVNLFSGSSLTIRLYLADIMQLSSNSFLDCESNVAESVRASTCWPCKLAFLESSFCRFGLGSKL